ncbi:MAG TPA: protoporphyrinogen oxidase [Terriglobales bacterium]|nr:protoporphyrinogen oxidase [Terriglobales bacterium]
MKRIAIIGGGIAGLSAAFYLERARRGGAAVDWALFEKSDRLGGVIKTERREDFVLEAGPDSFLTMKPDGAQFCRDLGIGDQLISSNDAERKTYILVKGRLVPIPEGLEFMVPTRVLPMATTPLFSWSTKLRMAREWFSGGGNQDHDESVADFVRRHFGQEMVDRVAEPLLAGVYGGNADKMSVRAVLPRFAEMERESGSLVRATLKARRARTRSSAAPQPLFTSLKNGMQEIVDAALSALPPDHTRLEREVISVRPLGDDWQIESGNRTERFQAVVVAVPAVAAAALMRQIHPGLIEGLARITYSSSAAVLLAYDKAALPRGHGFLVPRTEGRKLLACTFVHKKFPHRAPAGAALLRCFISSSRVPDLMSYSDEALLETARGEIQEILSLGAEPRLARVFRWNCALPQYETGHLERVAAMEKILAEMPGLELIGNSFYGIGIPDCIKSGKTAAQKLISS